MRFPNAFSGVKKIFTAEILALIASVVMVIGAFLALVGAGAAAAAEVDAASGLLIGAGALIVASGIVMIISFIFNIIGVSSAARDEPAFKSAMIAILAGIVCSLLNSIFSNNEVIATIAQAGSRVCEVLVTIFCITGIRNLAGKMNDGAIKTKAENLLKVICCVYILSILCTLVSLIFGGSFGATVSSIFSIASSILAIVAYILYLSLLSKAKKMLAK